MTRETLLRPVLLVDAVTCAAMGLLLLLAGAMIAGLTGLPGALLQGAGMLLLPFALFVFWASRRASGWPVQAVASANIAWVAASLALLVGPWIAPNLLGTLFIVGQAATVSVLAALQFHGLGMTTMAAR